MTTKSRRKTYSKAVIKTPEGIAIEEAYCRMCMRNRHPRMFYSAVDKIIDKNGLMSVCKDCIGDVYTSYYNIHNDMRKAIFECCKIFNLAYSETALDATETQMADKELKGTKTGSPFGYYKSKLSSYMRGFAEDDGDLDLTFKAPAREVAENVASEMPYDAEYLEEFWGKGLGQEQYEYLENEMSKYKKFHKIETAAEVSIFKNICRCEWQIFEAISAKTPTTQHLKTMQELMKAAGIQPSQTTVSSSSKSQETFSAFIKMIEETEPAEYYKDKELFKDFDNIDYYFKKYVTRPLKNFTLLSRDFSLDTDDDDEDGFTSIEDMGTEAGDGGKA